MNQEDRVLTCCRQVSHISYIFVHRISRLNCIARGGGVQPRRLQRKICFEREWEIDAGNSILTLGIFDRHLCGGPFSTTTKQQPAVSAYGKISTPTEMTQPTASNHPAIRQRFSQLPPNYQQPATGNHHPSAQTKLPTRHITGRLPTHLNWPTNSQRPPEDPDRPLSSPNSIPAAELPITHRLPDVTTTPRPGGKGCQLLADTT